MSKKIITIMITLLMLSCCGCGNNTEQILNFQSELNNTIMEMEKIHTELNTMDMTSPTASQDALDNLKALKDCFEELSMIQVVSDEYNYVSDLSKEGYEYMSQAYDLFLDAYNSEEFSEEAADLAYKYLERATKRVNVLVTLLHGEIPEGVIIQ